MDPDKPPLEGWNYPLAITKFLEQRADVDGGYFEVLRHKRSPIMLSVLDRG